MLRKVNNQFPTENANHYIKRNDTKTEFSYYATGKEENFHKRLFPEKYFYNNKVCHFIFSVCTLPQ